ncbi:MAG: AraC family transcriptional regulator [Calditrichaeota bacterium]|nr:AraC family transcriptional regulator [Calditrichota bacterium]RQV92907.1 MAG: AraC family transcriptional regulator [bacterium]RQW02651.1 MAG: AraC family transcriptional regulator [Calditrichota bacterium]
MRSVDLIAIAVLVAAAQGLFLTLYIFQKYRKLFANRFLGGLVLCCSLVLLHLFLQDTGIYDFNPRLLYLFIGLPFIVGPLHFFYAKSLINPEWRPGYRSAIHLLPLLIFEFLMMPQIFSSSESLQKSFLMLETSGLTPAYILFNWIIIIQGIGYTVMTLVMIRKYALNLQDVMSNTEKVRLDWLKNVSFFALIAWTVFMSESTLFYFGINFSNYFKLSSFLIATFVYTLGYVGVIKSDLYLNPTFSGIPADRFQKKNIPEGSGRVLLPKYEKSGLSEEKTGEYLKKLLQLMEHEKPYQQSDLTLLQLAEMVSIKPHNLSEIINTRLHENFFEFVNRYRVENVKEELKNPDRRHLKILSIAYDAGFNSKSSFNTIFKKFEGMTPSEYKKHHDNNV